MPERKHVRTGRDELPLILLTRPLPYTEEAVTVKLVGGRTVDGGIAHVDSEIATMELLGRQVPFERVKSSTSEQIMITDEWEVSLGRDIWGRLGLRLEELIGCGR